MFESLENRTLFSASLRGDTLTITATPDSDVIRIDRNGTKIVVRDNAVLREFLAAAVHEIVVNLAGGNDSVTAQASLRLPITANGGAGNDTIRTGAGLDVLRGGDGDDTLDGRTGIDEFFGGNGVDTADFSSRTDELSITLDGLDNDGERNGRSNVHSDIENVNGGAGDDYIRGSSAANRLFGFGGNDLIEAGGGNDYLDGGTTGTDYGADTLSGDSGNDTLHASEYGDYVQEERLLLQGTYLDGGSGNDRLGGGHDGDTLDGGGGNDQLTGGDGDDFMSDASIDRLEFAA